MARSPEGGLVVIEVKTGNASLSKGQKRIYGFINSGDSFPRGKNAEVLDLNPDLRLRDQGYPDGIPVVVQGFPGLPTGGK